MTPLGANGKPSPQRILVGEEDGVPALRVLPDREHAREAWWTRLAGVLIAACPLVFLPPETVKGMVGIILVTAIGIAILLPAVWAAAGATVIRIFPTHVSVQWRVGPIRFERTYPRQYITGIVLAQRTGHLLPMPMSGFGLLAAIKLDSLEGATPILMSRAVVVETVAAWLSDQLQQTVRVEESGAAEEPEGDLPVHESWEEVTPQRGIWGEPQRIWKRHRDGNFEIAILTIPGNDSFAGMIRSHLGGVVGGLVSLALGQLFVAQDFSNLLIGITITIGLGIVILLIAALVYWIRGPRPLNKRTTTFRIGNGIIAMFHPGGWAKTEASLHLAHAYEIVENRVLIAISFYTDGLFGNGRNDHIARLRSEVKGTETELKLHPATAEVLAQLIHEETGIPIERVYV